MKLFVIQLSPSSCVQSFRSSIRYWTNEQHRTTDRV